jgi:hypothetical protein
MYDSAGVTQLLVGAVNGYIYQYNNIDNNLLGSFSLVDSMYHGIYEPQRITVASRDITGDGIREILTGNYAGGVTIYKFDSTTSVAEYADASIQFQLYPNPSSSQVVLRFADGANAERRTIRFIDVTGREVLSIQSERNTVQIPVSEWSNGMYRCVVYDSQGRITSRNLMVSKP